MLPTKFWFIWPSGFRGEDFLEIDQSETDCLWRPSLLTNRDDMSIIYRRPSIDASYQDSFHLAMQFQRRRIFKNWSIRNKNCLWRPCLLTDRDEMCNIYREPSIDSSYQVSVHLAKRFQRRRFSEINQLETRIACGGHVYQWIRTKCAIFIKDLP